MTNDSEPKASVMTNINGANIEDPPELKSACPCLASIPS